LLHFEGLRSDFSASFLDSGAETIQSMRVAAPPIAGTARLMVTVVHEWIRWFDEPGFRCHTVEIDLVVS
jgi:hypothetical protein